jgi:hypothetical protein
MKGRSILSNDFSASIEINMWFIIWLVRYLVINWFSYVESSLYPRGTSHVGMMYKPFQYAIELGFLILYWSFASICIMNTRLWFSFLEISWLWY